MTWCKALNLYLPHKQPKSLGVSYFKKMSKYSEKLRSPKWQKKRLEILSRDNFTCRYCKDAETELHIHHLEYNGEPWQVENDKLITLCKNCHEIESTVGEIFKVELIGNGKIYRLKDSVFLLDYKLNLVVIRFNPESEVLESLFRMAKTKTEVSNG